MRLTAQALDIRGALAGTEVQIARSVTAGMREVTDGLKEDLRAEVREAGLGPRLANTWRGQTFPKTGESADAAAYVSSNAPKLIDAFDRGVTIKAKNGQYLAIPTPDAGVRQLSKRRTKGSTDNTLSARSVGAGDRHQAALHSDPERRRAGRDAFYRGRPRASSAARASARSARPGRRRGARSW